MIISDEYNYDASFLTATGVAVNAMYMAQTDGCLVPFMTTDYLVYAIINYDSDEMILINCERK